MQGPQKDPCFAIRVLSWGNVFLFCSGRRGWLAVEHCVWQAKRSASPPGRAPGHSPGPGARGRQGAGLGVEVPEFGVEVASSGRGPGAQGRGGEFEVEVPEL